MPKVSFIVGLFLMAFLLVDPGHAQDSGDACPYPKGRKIEDIATELAAHTKWRKEGGWSDPDIPGRLNFCNADLSEANLQGANLFEADLQGAILPGANLQRANLVRANLREAILTLADLQGANLQGADLQGADLSSAMLQGADLRDAELQGAGFGFAQLQGANLVRANLQDAELALAALQGANLAESDLQGAYLGRANLEGAYLWEANLTEADLAWANLEGAVLKRAKLPEADLTEANLRSASLDQSILSNAVLLRADLSDALYQPATAPASGSLSGLKGLGAVRFCPGEGSGLVQLREAFKEAGLRDPERVVTNTLERIRTDYALAQWNGLKFEKRQCPDLERDRTAAIEGVFRLVFFEWTTAYGLAYGRPILILLALIGVFSLVYLPALLIPERILGGTGIYRILPEGRIEYQSTASFAAKEVVVERLNPHLLSALGLAFYFSVVSAFHLGWRDLNVGTWIARLQPREYALRAKGWVRVVSGTQSLISVYLVAMWVLTYFGRPFG